MKLEILLSCMHQKDESIIHRSAITGNVLVINHCDREEETALRTERGVARIISTTQRGLTRSRNMAISKSNADICLLCDDDEIFVQNYEEKILAAYEENPQSDVIIFKIANQTPSFPDRTMELKFPRTMKVSSYQISFRRESLLRTGVRFDELLGAGTGNGAEEELKFLTDCRRAGLRIFYVPVEIAELIPSESTWFHGFTEEFFLNRGATTRYILGYPLAAMYGIYYVVRKRRLYAGEITPGKALGAIFRGIHENKIGKQAKIRK